MYPRFVEPRIRDALADTRVVLLSGPRQSGKTTLGRKLADDGVNRSSTAGMFAGSAFYNTGPLRT